MLLSSLCLDWCQWRNGLRVVYTFAIDMLRIYKVLMASFAVQLQMGTCACGTRSLSLRSNPGGSKASHSQM